MSVGSITQFVDESFEDNYQEFVNFENINEEDLLQYEGTSVKLEDPNLAQQLHYVEVEGNNLPYMNVLVAKENFKGNLNFEATIPANHGSKVSWVYSHLLKKIYTTERTKFPVHFKCDWQNQLYIRAMPIFSDTQHAQDLVRRCFLHQQQSDPTNLNLPPHVCDHVLRSADQPGAVYQGSVKLDQRLSVVIPLGFPQTGNDSVVFTYEFVCKNSCVRGMDRKPLEVIFTLEDQHCNILGRQTFGAKICSCPKRDKEKEEGNFHRNKDGGKSKKAPMGKKRKINTPPSFTETSGTTPDLRVYTIPSIQIVGKDNAEAFMKYIQDRMAGDFCRTGLQVYNNYLNEYKQITPTLTENSGNNV